MKATRAIILASTLLFPASARAATITYTIDPARSPLVGSGSVRNIPFSPQTTNGLRGAVGGSLRAEWRETGLTFSRGSSIVAEPHPEGPFVPSAAAVGSGAIVGNFGAEGRVFGAPVLSAAVRDAIADILSGRADYGGPVTDLTFGFVKGTVDYHDQFNDELDWFELTELDPVFNTANGILARTLQKDLDTITLPIFVELQFEVFAPNDSQLTLQGQLVATSPVLTIERDTLTTITSTQHLAALNIEPGATVKLMGGMLVTKGLNLDADPMLVFTPDVSGASAVPEPASWLLLALAGLAALLARRSGFRS